METQLSLPQRAQPPPIFSPYLLRPNGCMVHAYCGQTARWMKLVLGMKVGLSPGDFMLHGDPAPSPKRGRRPLPNFRPISIVVKRLDSSRCHLVWLRRHCVRWGPRSSPQKGGGAPQFSAHVYCGHTAGWMKLVLGTDVGLIPGNFMLHGDPAPSPKRGRIPLPNFQPISIVAKRLDASTCHLVWM